MVKKFFCLFLILIYIGYLAKDNIIYLFSKFDNSRYQALENNYYENEYHNLTKTLELTNYDYKIIISKVILRDIYTFFDKITIDKGSLNNINNQNIVVNEEGVIGLINTCQPHSCEVYLLTNNKINLSVKINNEYGILTGKDDQVLVKNIKDASSIQVGDKIYTSGLTSIKENLLIGEVADIQKDPQGLESIIKVQLKANLNNLKYVGVIP